MSPNGLVQGGHWGGASLPGARNEGGWSLQTASYHPAVLPPNHLNWVFSTSGSTELTGKPRPREGKKTCPGSQTSQWHG